VHPAADYLNRSGCAGRSELHPSRRTAIARERRDPLAKAEPMSLWLIGLWVATLFVAGFYIGRYSGAFSGDSLEPVPVAQVIENTSSATKAAQPPPTPDSGGVTKVMIENMKFDPPTIEVQKGAIVEWTNSDITPHTATSGSFDSGSIDSDKSWRHAFTEGGSFPYACTFHPEMKGTIIVKE